MLLIHHPFRSLVAFGPKQRALGESAKTQETSNFKNTIGSLKRLLGRTLNDVEVQEYEKKFINASLVDVGGSVGVEVCLFPLSTVGLVHNIKYNTVCQ